MAFANIAGKIAKNILVLNIIWAVTGLNVVF